MFRELTVNKTPSTNSFRQTREPRLAMEPVVIACGGCGTAIRIRHPEIARRRVCPRCRTDLTRDQDPVCRQSLARLTGILIAALLLGTGVILFPGISCTAGAAVPQARWASRPRLAAHIISGKRIMLGALTSASRSAASHLRGESPPARPDTAPAQLAPASALPPSPTLLAMRTTTHEGDDEKIAPAAPPLPCAGRC